jgi:membrane protein YqaA with SNARE-associated domain
LIKLLSVFGAGMIGLWEGIPLGFVLGLSPVVIALVSAAGSTSATLLVLLLGERVRARLVKPREPGKERWIDRIFQRHGVIGLGLVAPFLTGAPIGVAIGLFFRAPVRLLLFWAIVGIALWAALLTGVGVYGDAGIRKLVTGG